MALLGVAVGAVVTLLASLLAEPAAQWFRDGQYRNVAPIAVPVSLQAALYLVQLPFAASLRGMQLARLLFVQYAVFSSASLVGVVVGASQGGLLGAAWGLALGASVGFVTMVAIYLFAIGRHARAG
jgi:O-antigen/teichoic acid export membrane protein